MSFTTRFKAHAGRWLVAGFACTALFFLSGEHVAKAQSPTILMDFRFDNNTFGDGLDGTSAGATNVSLSPNSPSRTYTVDIWVTVVPVSTTASNQLGLKSAAMRGISNFVTGAFATGTGIGVVSGSFAELSPFNPSGFTQPLVSDLGKSTNGGSTVTDGTADGILDFGGTIAAQRLSISSSSGGAVFGGGATGSANTSTTPNGWQFELGTFSFKIGNVSSVAGTTTFSPLLLSSNGSAAAYSVNGGTTTPTGPTTVGSPLTFTVLTGNDSVITTSPAPNGTLNFGREMSTQASSITQAITVSHSTGSSNTGATATASSGAALSSAASSNGQIKADNGAGWTTNASLTSTLGAHTDTVTIQNTGNASGTASGTGTAGSGTGMNQGAISINLTGNVLAKRTVSVSGAGFDSLNPVVLSANSSLANAFTAVTVNGGSTTIISSSGDDASKTRVNVAASGTDVVSGIGATVSGSQTLYGGGPAVGNTGVSTANWSVSAAFKGFTTSGSVNLGVSTAENGGTGLTGEGSYSPVSVSYTASIGGATANRSNNVGTFGTPLTATVAQGVSYAGLESQVVGGSGTGAGSDAFVGASNTEVAKILAGVNNTSNSGGGNTAQVSMAWRYRVNTAGASPVGLDEVGGGPGTANPSHTVGLASNVVMLTGLTPGAVPEGGELPGVTYSTDPFVLDVSYNPNKIAKGPASEPGAAANGNIYLVSLDGPTWQNAVNANSGQNHSLFTNYQGSFLSFVGQHNEIFGFGSNPTTAQLASITTSELNLAMGAWGVDISTHEAWAVVNHNSEFAVVPEPATFVLAGLGVLGLVAVRRRRKS